MLALIADIEVYSFGVFFWSFCFFLFEFRLTQMFFISRDWMYERFKNDVIHSTECLQITNELNVHINIHWASSTYVVASCLCDTCQIKSNWIALVSKSIYHTIKMRTTKVCDELALLTLQFRTYIYISHTLCVSTTSMCYVYHVSYEYKSSYCYLPPVKQQSNQ